MHWNPLTDVHQLDEIVETSQNQPVVIFKHSTRCSISSTALSRFERAWGPTENAAFYLDLIAYRPISLEIAAKFGIEHQSPQVLVISQGNCTYSATHWDISVDELKPYLSE
jgi:bacillithiol system protein YtxJ